MQTIRPTSAGFATKAEPARAIITVAGVLVSGMVAFVLSLASLISLLTLVLMCPAAQEANGAAGLKQGATPTRLGGQEEH